MDMYMKLKQPKKLKFWKYVWIHLDTSLNFT